MPQLINTAQGDAMFGDVPMYDTSTVTVEIPSIKVDKKADMDVWRGDELTYTITVTNLDEAITATNVVVTDTIDPALAKLILDSVMIDGTPLDINNNDFTYDEATGELVIPSPTGTYTIPGIPPGQSRVITFRVTKA